MIWPVAKLGNVDPVNTTDVRKSKLGRLQIEVPLLKKKNRSFPIVAQETERELPGHCPGGGGGGGVGASQQLLRRWSGSFPMTAQEEGWSFLIVAHEVELEPHDNCSEGGVGASQLLLRKGLSSPAEGTRVTLRDLLQNHFWDRLPNYRAEGPLRAFW